MNPFVQQNIENWASDYAGSDRVRQFSAATRDYSATLLTEFLLSACGERDIVPEELEDADIKAALLNRVARLSLPEAIRNETVALCADFLTSLQEEGRIANGRALAAFARALSPAFQAAAGGKARPITNPGSKLGRNDPCPCGSGQKYKKCCMRE